MLAQLADIKQRLDIPAGDVSQDADLTDILAATSDKILGLCRYSETDIQGHVEILTNVQQSRQYRSELRNLAAPSGTPDPAVFLVEGRGHGTTFLQLSVDVLDPLDGTWMILGAAEWWPPNYVEERRPKFRRWREPIWPVVRVTYDVNGISDGGVPPELKDATVSLAIHWLGQSKAGAVRDVTIGQLKQTISDDPVPAHVRSMLGKHYRGVGATWVR